jgi:hypothetical protein
VNSEPEYIDDQQRRLALMAKDDGGDKWDLSDNDRAACQSGADAIDIVREFMATPCWRPDEPSEMEKATYSRMRELLFRGSKP